MSAIAIRFKSDFRKIALALLTLVFLAMFLSFALPRMAAMRGVSEVPLKPCQSCATCLCPRLQGSISCGCPR